jgi:hypothetical protein
MAKREKPKRPEWTSHPYGARFGDVTSPYKESPKESNPELMREQIAAAMAPTRTIGDNSSPAQDFIDAVIDERERWNLMTPEQRAREDRARKLAAAGYAEVNGEVMRKDKAKEKVEDAMLDGEPVDFLGLGPVDVPEDEDDYFTRQEQELAAEMEEEGW